MNNKNVKLKERWRTLKSLFHLKEGGGGVWVITYVLIVYALLTF